MYKSLIIYDFHPRHVCIIIEIKTYVESHRWFFISCKVIWLKYELGGRLMKYQGGLSGLHCVLVCVVPEPLVIRGSLSPPGWISAGRALVATFYQWIATDTK